MYCLPYFKAEDRKQVIEFMQQNPFVILTGCDADNRPVATHVPLLIKEREGKLFLQGHIMKQTDHHKAFLQNEDVLAIFTGPHAYVSASWYKDQKQGSTWNYVTVHAHGKLRLGEEELLLQVLEELTDHFENNPNSPSRMKHLSKDYVDRLVKAIVAFEIEVTGIENVFKLSQNRDEESYKNIVQQLKQGDDGAKAIAEMMEKNHDV